MSKPPNVRHTLLLSFATNYATMAMQFVASLIVARLLSPSEIGIFSIAAVMVQLASVVRDFGVGEYLIVVKDLTHEKIRAAFTLNLLLSWGMGLVIFLLRDVAAIYFKEPGVAQVLTVTAMSFALIPFGAITVAYFRRQQNYRPVMIASVLSAFVSGSVSVGLGYAGFSYMSLAWGSLAGVSTMVLTMIVMRPADFPRLPGLRGIREAVSFGSTVSVMSILKQVGRVIPDLVIGRAVNMAGVGLYSRAAGLLEIFNSSVLLAVQRVALPYFAEVNRSSGSVANAFSRATHHIVVISWPFSVMLAILAVPVIQVLYGSTWLPAAPLVQLLAIGFAIETLFFTAQDAVLASGQPGVGAKLQFATLLTRMLILFGAAPFGLLAICAAFPVSAAISAVIIFETLRRTIALKVEHLSRALRDGLLITTACGASSAIVIISTRALQLPLGVAFVAGGLLGTATWLAAIFLLKHPLSNELVKALQKLKARTQR